jgi:ribonuclease R
MELTKKLREFIQSGALGFFKAEEFANTMSSAFSVKPEEIITGLNELKISGFLTTQNGKLVMSMQIGLMAADLQVTLRGYGFAIVPDQQDTYIARNDLHGAVDGDKVLVGLKKDAKKREGYIAEILERRVQNVVGTVIRSKTQTFIIPDDERLGQSLEVRLTAAQKSGKNDLPSGQKVVARFDEDYKSQRVYITEVLGDPLTVGVDILSIIRAHNLYQEFPAAVVNEARNVCAEPSEDEIKRRTDLRKKLLITIDPDDAKDLDDAVSLEQNPDGTQELGVHIADVSHYVTEDSELDKEAYKRGTSVYFPDRVLPMLPKQLSNDICSLHPNVPRLALSVFMTLDRDGNVLKHKICESIINIQRRFNYNEVQKILDGEVPTDLPKDIHDVLIRMSELTPKIEKSRRTRGEVTFEVPEPKIILCPKTGKIKDVIAYPHYLSHRIIETFMVLCNETVAKAYCELNAPFIYRTHERPDAQKVARFLETLKPFAVEHKINPEYPTGFAYQGMLEKLQPNIKPIVSSLALRSMQKAKYTPDCTGHFGLGAKYYCHFTSPIRRYPDLVIHRIIKLMLNKKLNKDKTEDLHDFVRDASDQSSKTELAASEAEREVDNLKRAEYMQDHIGERFSGHISGIMEFGVFVYLPNTVEGLIKIENMPRDNYKFNERQALLIGAKKTYRMGDKIDVIIAGVNMVRRQVEFSVAGGE